MASTCRICGKVLSRERTVRENVANGICADCIARISEPADREALLESIDGPVLLMQGNPRQVVAGNRKALDLFGKETREVENHRGGQVFDCVHSFTEAGCGKDANCEHCKIKNAIVDTFTTSEPHAGVSTELSIKKADGTRAYALQVSTEKIGELALVRVERYEALKQ